MADISYQPPQTTGNDVLAYKGDANLAGGFDSKGMPQGVGEASVIPVMDMLKTLQGQQFMRNTQDYNEALKERDQSIALLSDPSLNIDMDVADKDRPALNDQRQKLIDMWKKNPGMDNTDDIVNFQKEAGIFRQMATSSKARSLENKRQINAIAAETNPEVRKQMIDHLNDEMDQGVFHQVDPYFKNPTFSADMFAPVPEQQVGTPDIKQDAQGAYFQTTNYRVPVSAFSAFVSPEALMANNGERLQQLQILHDNFVKSPFSSDANFLTTVNQKLADINTKNNLAPTDPNYLQPLASDDGSGWQVNASPAQFAKSLYAYSHYKEHAETKLADDYPKQLQVNANISKTYAETATEKQKPALLRSEANKNYADAHLKGVEAWEKQLLGPSLKAKYDAETEKLKAEGNKTAAEASQIKSDVSQPASDGLKMFSDVNKYVGVKGTAAEKPKWWNFSLQGAKDAGFEPDKDQELVPLPRDNNYVAALSIPQTDKAGNVGGGVIKPAHIFAIRQKDGKIGDVKIFGLDKDGKLMKSITVNDAAGELIKYNLNFKTTDKTNKQIDAAREVTNDMLGKHPDYPNGYGGTATIPGAIMSMPGGEKATPIKVEGAGTYYKLNGKYYDGNGKEITE